MIDKELVARVTKAVRQADIDFETVGGSSRHWVSDFFLPALEKEGLCVAPIEEKSKE